MIGVIHSRMPTKFLEDVIENLVDNKSEQYHLIDFSGKYFLVAGSAKEVVGRDAQADFPGLAQLQAPQKAVSQVMLDSKNVKKLVSYVPFKKLPGLPDLDWDILLTTNIKIAFAPQRQLLLTLAIGTGVSALLVGAIAAYLASRATRPILTATKAVEKLGQGKLDTRIGVAGEDELAVLGININLMADQLQTLLQEQQAETKRSQLFAEINLRIRQSLNLEEILSTTVQEIRQALQAERVFINRLEQEESSKVIVESLAPNCISALGAKLQNTFFQNIQRQEYYQGHIQAIDDVEQADLAPAYQELLTQLQVMASLVVPLFESQQLWDS